MVSTQYWVHLVSYEWCLVRKKMHSCEAVIILYSTKKYFFKIYLCLQVLRSRHVFSNYLLTYIIIIKYLLHKLINFYYNILNASIRRSDNSLVWNVQIVFFFKSASLQLIHSIIHEYKELRPIKDRITYKSIIANNSLE